jgi:hypothetical protein
MASISLFAFPSESLVYFAISNQVLKKTNQSDQSKLPKHNEPLQIIVVTPDIRIIRCRRIQVWFQRLIISS